jgi:hypothetical protein
LIEWMSVKKDKQSRVSGLFERLWVRRTARMTMRSIGNPVSLHCYSQE